MSQVLSRRKGNQISKKEKSKRIRGSVYVVHYPNMWVPEMKTKKKNQEKDVFLKSRRKRKRRKGPELEHVQLW